MLYSTMYVLVVLLFMGPTYPASEMYKSLLQYKKRQEKNTPT